MIPKSERPAKLISLEIARFAAALCVALRHLSGAPFLLQIGPNIPLILPSSAAVSFFFTLSGFVIYHAHGKDISQWQRLPRYVWRRFLRIYPLYWVTLAPMLYFLWPYIVYIQGHGHLTALLTLSPFTGGNFSELNRPAWSLRCEVAFYGIFALALLPRIGRFILPAWAMLLALAWGRSILGLGTPVSLLPFLPAAIALRLLTLNNIMFFAGIIAAWAFARRQPGGKAPWIMLCASAAGLALLVKDWGNLYQMDGRLPASSLAVPFIAIAFAGLIFSLAALEHDGKLRLHPRLSMLGSISYPIYLIHIVEVFLFMVLFSTHPALRHGATPLGMFILMSALLLLSSWLLVVLFDNPLQRLGRRLMR